MVHLGTVVDVTVDYKRSAIEQWTADPCGASVASGEPGSRSYFESLLRARAQYAPWMADVLNYPASAGLDVLDVGCGQGIDLARYAAAGARATGVDLTPRHVELARAHLAALGLRGQVVEGDAEALPFEDKSFDQVSSNGVLHHTPDLDAALREVVRVLRPGGKATVIVYNRHSLHYWINQVLLEGILKHGLFTERSMSGVLSHGVEHSSIEARPLVRVYGRRQLREHLLAAGFADVRITVRHFNAGDVFVIPVRLSPYVLRPAVRDRLGRAVGWYLIATAKRPHESVSLAHTP